MSHCRSRFATVSPLAFLVILLTVQTGLAADRPNIVMVFADDWGKYASAYAKLSPGGISD